MVRNRGEAARSRVKPNLVTSGRLSAELEAELALSRDNIAIAKASEAPHPELGRDYQWVIEDVGRGRQRQVPRIVALLLK
jgi:hypothetical protein